MIEIEEVSGECPVQRGQGFVFSGAMPPEVTGASTFAWTEFTGQTGLILLGPGAAAAPDCAELIRQRLRELAPIMGADLSGKTVTVKIAPLKDDGASTEVDPADPSMITLTVDPRWCMNPPELQRMILAHELDHARRLTGPAVQPELAAKQTLVAAEAAKAANPRNAALVRARRQAELDYLRKLRDDENAAFDAVRDQAAGLGLGPADLAENERLRASEIDDLDRQIHALEQLLR